MRKDFILYSMLGLMAGCSAEDSPVDLVPVSTIQINARNFELPSTRTIIDSQDYSVAWATKDAIGIFPEEGNQIAFSIDNEIAGNHAVFNGEGWKLDGDRRYAAYYPCIDKAFLNKTSIPLDPVPLNFSMSFLILKICLITLISVFLQHHLIHGQQYSTHSFRETVPPPILGYG